MHLVVYLGVLIIFRTAKEDSKKIFQYSEVEG